MRQDANYNFSYDLQKFIEERLSPVVIEGKLNDETASATEVAQARAVLGSLNWRGREGRPDLASRIPELRVKDLREMNRVVERAQSTAELAVTIKGIPEDKIARSA
eukprot:s3494_g3.t1